MTQQGRSSSYILHLDGLSSSSSKTSPNEFGQSVDTCVEVLLCLGSLPPVCFQPWCREGMNTLAAHVQPACFAKSLLIDCCLCVPPRICKMQSKWLVEWEGAETYKWFGAWVY